jgi:hypothetical protein
LGLGLSLITNSTKVIGVATQVHSLISFGAECLEDSGNLLLLPLDMTLFGQSIPVGDADRFNMMNFKK